MSTIIVMLSNGDRVVRNSKFVDRTGVKIGNLTAIGPFDIAKNGHTRWLCWCDLCSSIKPICWPNVVSQKSCGCQQNPPIHGHTVAGKWSREYTAYNSMMKRCFNPNRNEYDSYGGRGITVCNEWASSFSQFLADMGNCPDGLTLDRINNDGNYEPSNCRWTDDSTQRRNKRVNRFLTHGGKTMVAADWADFLTIPRQTLYGRLNRGWSTSRALTTS